ncbi:peptide chain release factor 1 PrfA [Ochromonadaceae sp. CCMP2298]|nr:peptide chain release factor 1 PrfA [Ochromonadaceae sp. CCMP2298]|mmetsp:Transcript_30963/g.68389  ORF Transcript_30963/g.68389 Transcript_30963/m.68389 type:complete len:412 (-) Transcript_30963:241-1476(-)|eukprot:CAMPEP_0173215686 /NCGR_PEP_ID=MMETSP1141-20130122/26628_1 /TAXON_ID=483371 /ORGANISM="non described non described, Strain CCMP2298" /LENGTH=411 /DNA_ID=CAMNT_0014143113 /DNA_START=55 /DNA_END=1290 /DNA_ORIENTATION=-
MFVARRLPNGVLASLFRTSKAPHFRATVVWSMSMSMSMSGAKTVLNKQLEVYLESRKTRYAEVEEELSKAEIDVKQIAKLGKEMAELGRLMSLSQDRGIRRATVEELLGVEVEAAGDEEMEQLARQEREENEAELENIENSIVQLLTPKDEADDGGVVLEVRAGTGGDEASLFAGEVFKMYQKFASLQGWTWEELSLSRSDAGGFKEAQALINGHGKPVYKVLKYEAGVHRVQRVPSNDVRIHTSAASVIILPEAEDIDFELRMQDIKIDVFRSQGAGGQSVNKTESAVRFTHIPTGIKVEMQDERSQIQNRARAYKYLKARVYDFERQKVMQLRSELRSLAGGTGDRADKIRTYNFPQDRVTDHRISLTMAGVERVLGGESLSMLTDALGEYDEKEKLRLFLEDIEAKDV